MTSSFAAVSFTTELSDKEVTDLRSELEAFVVQHTAHHRPIALVTSGGTVVDLEKNSVRCLDNFSTGLRGSISVEEFLKRGYAVVHLWRQGSASPFGRVLSQSLGISQANFGVTFDSLGHLFDGTDTDQEEQMVKTVLEESNDPWLTESKTRSSATASMTPGDGSLALHRRLTHSSRLQRALRDRTAVLQEGRLLIVPFRSVEEYLAKLQLCAEALRDSNSLAILYLAAAVSDFYVPSDLKSEHKIQSGGKDGLVLELKPVPKVMGLLRESWAPDAFVVSFKLETDKDILRQKAEGAVEKYKVHMVIGNLLDSRHEMVSVLYPTSTNGYVSEWPMKVIDRPKSSDLDALEEALLDFVVEQHFAYISRHWNGPNASTTEAAIRNHERLQEKKRQVQRELFWKRVRTETLALAGPLIGAVLTYSITSLLRNRIMQNSR
jgi:phosphopantothenate-cysteine ligase